MCNLHHNVILEYFHQPPKKLHPFSSHSPNPWWSPVGFLSLWVHLLWTFHVNKVIQYVGFRNSRLSLSVLLHLMYTVESTNTALLFIARYSFCQPVSSQGTPQYVSSDKLWNPCKHFSMYHEHHVKLSSKGRGRDIARGWSAYNFWCRWVGEMGRMALPQPGTMTAVQPSHLGMAVFCPQPSNLDTWVPTKGHTPSRWLPCCQLPRWPRRLVAD